jgi:WD40 repeat protein
VNSAVFSHDGKLVATASGQYGRPGLARAWKTDTGTPITGPLPHADGVVAVSFSEDDRRLVTASFDRTARVWDVNSGQPVGEPLAHDGFVTSAMFAGSRHRVLTTTWDGKAWLWNLPEDDDPVPAWLADVAEAIGGSRLNEADVFEPVPPDALFALREGLTRGESSDGCSRFIRWFFAPRPSRAIAPGSSTAIPAFVDRRIEEGTESALERASLADPGNARVWKLLQKMKEASP